MSSDSRKSAETATPETQVLSGWDPFTVWRERVHKPRTTARTARPVVDTPPRAVLDPIKQSG